MTNDFSLNWLYDGSGNPTTYKSATFGFDPEDRLTSISSPAFYAAYDGDGLRIKKTATPVGGSSPVTTYFLYDGGSPVVEETYNGSTAALSAVNGEAADGWRARYDRGMVFDYAFDPQGSVVQRQTAGDYAAGAAAFDETFYEGYGALRQDYDVVHDGGTPTHKDPVGFGGQFGYYTDPETGLLCLTHRYYDPGTGKFINRDPIGYAGGQNLYAFCAGNPVNGSDPDGTKDPAAAGEWIDKHWFHGFVSRWAWSQGMADSGHATQYQVMQHAVNAVNAVGDFIVLVALPETEAADPEVLAEEESGAVTVYRVEGRVNRRLKIGASGEVGISEGNTLFLNFGNSERAEEFYKRRVAQGMKGVQLKSFQVPVNYVGDLDDQSVLEHEAHLFPDRPLRVDIKAAGQYGLRANHIEGLKRVIVPGSGRVIH